MKYLPLATLFLCTFACSSSENDGSPTDDGSGGAASGGQSSGSSGGTSGSTGGISGSGGESGGAGSGGADSGGSASGGEGMIGGGAGEGSGGAQGSGGSDPGLTLEECFDGLRDAVGGFQDATKESADSSYRMRLALETGDRGGTSGTVPWLPLAFGIETPDGVVCWSDESELEAGYTVSHHNCDDTLVLTDGDRRYEISTPDSASDYVNPEIWRRPSTLTLYENDQIVGEPIRLDTVSCNATSSGDGLCRSGGPC